MDPLVIFVACNEHTDKYTTYKRLWHIYVYNTSGTYEISFFVYNVFFFSNFIYYEVFILFI